MTELHTDRRQAELVYDVQVVGDDRSDRAMILAFHGGGGFPRDVNDEQYEKMKKRYVGSARAFLASGAQNCASSVLYVCVRGLEDVWNMHFLPRSYQLLLDLMDRLVAEFSVNPARISLIGYSAGGDAVFNLAANFADRLCFACSSAGHPNGAMLENTLNFEVWVQQGLQDFAWNRNASALEAVLDTRKLAQGAGVDHSNLKIFMHAGKGHQICDNCEDFAPQLVVAQEELPRLLPMLKKLRCGLKASAPQEDELQNCPFAAGKELITVLEQTNPISACLTKQRVLKPGLVIWKLTPDGSLGYSRFTEELKKNKKTQFCGLSTTSLQFNMAMWDRAHASVQLALEAHGAEPAQFCVESENSCQFSFRNELVTSENGCLDLAQFPPAPIDQFVKASSKASPFDEPVLFQLLRRSSEAIKEPQQLLLRVVALCKDKTQLEHRGVHALQLSRQQNKWTQAILFGAFELDVDNNAVVVEDSALQLLVVGPRHTVRCTSCGVEVTETEASFYSQLRKNAFLVSRAAWYSKHGRRPEE